jgi:hypothetical protein
MRKLLLATAMVLVATAANASGIHEMHFQKGKECWSYQGNDIAFVGKFLSWQDLTVKAFFETDDGLKDAKVKVYNLTSDGLEIPVTEAGSYQTPEGGNATFEIDVQIDRPYKNIHFHICAITEKVAPNVLSCEGTLINNHGQLRLRPVTTAIEGALSEGRTKPLHQDSRCNAVIPDGQVSSTVLKACKINEMMCIIEGIVVQTQSEWRWDSVSKVDVFEGD